MIKYFNREGIQIAKPLYGKLIADESYVIVRRFENDRIKIEVMWTGEVKDAQNYMHTMLPLFRINCWNIVTEESTGVRHLAIDPIMNGAVLHNEASAIHAYESFLASWTECSLEAKDDGTTELIEVGNKYTPPPPPDPNKPATAQIDEDCDEVGAW